MSGNDIELKMSFLVWNNIGVEIFGEEECKNTLVDCAVHQYTNESLELRKRRL